MASIYEINQSFITLSNLIEDETIEESVLEGLRIR